MGREVTSYYDKITASASASRNTSIKRLNPNEDGEVLYVIKPSKEGQLNLVVFRTVEGKMKEIGSRVLIIEK